MTKPKVTIKRTEQWEYTAYGYGEEGTGSSEVGAERDLLRKVVKNLLAAKRILKEVEKHFENGFAETKEGSKYVHEIIKNFLEKD